MYNEFLSKFRFPVTPTEYAVVFDALLKGLLQLLRSSTLEVSMIHLLNSSIFLGETDITRLNAQINISGILCICHCVTKQNFSGPCFMEKLTGRKPGWFGINFVIIIK